MNNNYNTPFDYCTFHVPIMVKLHITISLSIALKGKWITVWKYTTVKQCNDFLLSLHLIDEQNSKFYLKKYIL